MGLFQKLNDWYLVHKVRGMGKIIIGLSCNREIVMSSDEISI